MILRAHEKALILVRQMVSEVQKGVNQSPDCFCASDQSYRREKISLTERERNELRREFSKMHHGIIRHFLEEKRMQKGKGNLAKDLARAEASSTI